MNTPRLAIGGIVPAHRQLVTVHLFTTIPEHGPRGDAFEAAKERMKQFGLVHCVVPGCDTGAPIEYHHTWVENAMQNGIDVTKLDGIAGLTLTDEEFAAWVQSPGNLEPLCSVHHRTQLGIHHIPEPDWNALRAWKNGLPLPVEYVDDIPPVPRPLPVPPPLPQRRGPQPLPAAAVHSRLHRAWHWWTTA